MRTSTLGLVISLLLINAFGLTTIYSSAPSLLSNQLSSILVGLLAAFVIYRFRQHYPDLAIFAYITAVSLLVLTFIIGTASRGSLRWIQIGSFRLQTSEIAKPLLILAFAQFFDSPKSSFFWLFKQIVIALIPILLIARQPDLGSAIVISAIWFGLLLVSRAPIYFPLTLIIVALITAPIGYHFLHSYQQQRIISFLNPFADPSGSGYNVIQAMIAVGSGRLIGKGVRQGTQSQLQFLPERHTDFAFASFSEEFGLFGVLILISAFAYFLFWLLENSRRLPSYYRLVNLGVFWLFFTQITINIGMNLGLLPVTGITLPFISYGGSSVLALIISLGLVFPTQNSSFFKTRN